ncbi:hypothetical protein, partial [Paracoccus sp. (in: a-proteobacteria)]|uniref:hypothetical protein n=1 Tax=Paracoccus sp. TaxID=267 RepID=UPI0026E0BA31
MAGYPRPSQCSERDARPDQSSSSLSSDEFDELFELEFDELFDELGEMEFERLSYDRFDMEFVE